jgi:hypothetical protein
MGQRIKITARTIELIAELNSSKTAQAVWKALPVKGFANIWGNEIYFSIPVILTLESGKALVEMGDLCYWPQGNAFCIFFGPTPISKGDQIKPASEVSVFGKISGDATVLKKVTSGTKVVIEQLSDEEADQFTEQGNKKKNRELLVQDNLNSSKRQLVVKKTQTSAITIPPK